MTPYMNGKSPDSHILGPSRFDVAQDPTGGSLALPPNMGRIMVPQVFTQQGITSTLSRVYRNSDECMQDAWDNSLRMRNDVTVMECVEMRQRAVALLDWSLEPANPKNKEHKALAEALTDIIKTIPRFMQYQENLLHATWYGRYGVQQWWQKRKVNGHMRTCIPGWLPLHGDKLVFRYDDGTSNYRADQIGIRVGAGYPFGDSDSPIRDKLLEKIAVTDQGRAYFLDTWERPLLAIHKYRIEDGEYEVPLSAGRIHGVGLRSVIYWTWYQKQETLAFLMEYLERSAAGIEIWYYPMGNAIAEQRMRTAAQERIGQGRNLILVPRPQGEDAPYYNVERIEPSMAGAEQLKTIITEYFGHSIKRYILGQTLTSEASSTGLGSNLADIHLDTFMQIVRYDSMLLEETIKTELIDPLKRFNFPQYNDVDIYFRKATSEPDAKEMLDAFSQAWEMGLRIDAQTIRDLIGAPKPDDSAEILDKMQAEQAMQAQQGMGGPAGPMGPVPGQDGQGFPALPPPEPQTTGGSSPTEDAQYMASESPNENSDRHKLLAGDEPVHYSAQRYDGDGEEADIAALETDPNPSDAQIASGNYRKGKFFWNGLQIAIETRKGARRRPEWPEMPCHYGYIKRHISEADGDHLDVFIGPELNSQVVFVFDQTTKSGRFDEHKIVIGCNNEREAKALYDDSYNEGPYYSGMRPMLLDDFKEWLDKGDTSKKIEHYAAGFWDDQPRGDDGKWIDRTWEDIPKQQRSLKGQQGLFEDIDPAKIGGSDAPAKRKGPDPDQQMLFAAGYVEEDHPRDKLGQWVDKKNGTARKTPDSPQFNQWFHGSKIVDSDGNPLVVYHGTASDFGEFQKNKATDKEGRKLSLGWGKGKFYFSTSPESASNSADWASQSKDRPGKNASVMPVYLKITNPITAEEYTKRLEQATQDGIDRDKAIAALDKALAKEGVDGIVDTISGGIAVFDPRQIKSATGNSGSYNPDDPRINYAADQSRDMLGKWVDKMLGVSA